jgi:DNA repair exonuclease SbcCD ATPase subunit
MFKKLLVVGLIAGAAVLVLKGTKFFGYARQQIDSLQEQMEDRIPVEKKIAQMRKDVGALDKDIDAAKTDLARSIVEVRELTTQTADLRTALVSAERNLQARGETIREASNANTVKVGTVFLSIPEAKDRLKRDVDLHLKSKSRLASMEKQLGHHERIKETLEKQLDGLVRQKQELKAAIDAVEAEYKELQLQQIESKYQQDDTRLAKIKEDLRKMKKNLDIKREKLNLTAPIEESRPINSAPASTDSVDDILAPLTGKGDKIEKSGN